MGLFEKFAARAMIGIARAGANRNSSETGRYDSLQKKINNNDLDCKQIAVQRIMQKTQGAVRGNSGGCINYPEKGFEVTVLDTKTVISENRTHNRYNVQLTVFIALPDAESLVCEKYVSIGENVRSAVEAASDKFAAFLNTMFETYDGDDDATIINYYDGNEHIYKYSTGGVTTGVGDPSVQDFGDVFPLVIPELSGYLGAKKYYWLSFNIILDDIPSVTCSINGDKIERLSDLLREGVSDKLLPGKYGNFQQQVLIIQSDHTYVRAKENYNKARNAMHKFVREVIPLMGNSSAQLVSYDELFRKVQNITNDKNAAWELMTFLPEIFVQQVFKVRSTELVRMKLGDKELDLTEFQLNALSVIKYEVEQYLEKNDPSEEFQQNIFSLSSRFKAAMDAFNSGVKEEDLAFGALSCTAPDDYVIW